MSLLNFSEYLNKNSDVIIELIPIKNMNGISINIRNEDINYIYIYFNNNIVEIKRNYIKPNEMIDKIIIKLEYKFNNFKYMFYECKCLKTIIFIEFYINNILDISYMFVKCINLYKIKFNIFNTDNVTSMCCIFL